MDPFDMTPPLGLLPSPVPSKDGGTFITDFLFDVFHHDRPDQALNSASFVTTFQSAVNKICSNGICKIITLCSVLFVAWGCWRSGKQRLECQMLASQREKKHMELLLDELLTENSLLLDDNSLTREMFKRVRCYKLEIMEMDKLQLAVQSGVRQLDDRLMALSSNELNWETTVQITNLIEFFRASFETLKAKHQLLLQKLRKTREDNMCSICFVYPISRSLVPCGHGTCSSCAVRLHSSDCPYCRATVINIIPRY